MNCFVRPFRTAWLLLVLPMALTLLARPASGEEGASTTKAWKFDFGTAELADGYIEVDNAVEYAPERGYGWVGPGPEHLRDRQTADPLQRDYVFAFRDGTFRVDLPPGLYSLRMTFFDPLYDDHFTKVALVSGGKALAPLDLPVVNPPLAVVSTLSFTARVPESPLDLQFTSPTQNWILNSLVIEPTETEQAFKVEGVRPRITLDVPPLEAMLADLEGPFRCAQAKAPLRHHGPVARRLEPLLARQARYLLGTLRPWAKNPEALTLTASNSSEHDIRPNASTTLGLAVLARYAPDSLFDDTFTRARCIEAAQAIFRFILPTHGAGGETCNNGRQWRNQWQSAHWACAAGIAAWLLWDDLEPSHKWLAARMIHDEANRFVGQTPPAQVTVDTKAEENAWNSEVIALAYSMFPDHPKSEEWRETALVWALSSFVREADLEANPVVDGKPLKDRVTRANIFDDCTLENHHRVHPDYMNCITLCEYQKLSYDWAGKPAPEALFFNARCLYASLKKVAFPDGGWVYPNGQDWRIRRNADWFSTNVFHAVVHGDPQAARLMHLTLDVTERMFARTETGGLMLPGEYFFPSTQHSWFDWMSRAYLLLRAEGEGPAPTDEATLWKELAGSFVFDSGMFGVHRTAKSISTFSWGPQVMGMVMPLQRDLLLNPSERGLIGTVGVQGVEREHPKAKQVEAKIQRDSLTVVGIIERAGGAVEQRFAFVALPDDRTLYLDQVRATRPDVVVETLRLGLLGVLNDGNWVYHPSATRTLYHEKGNTVFAAVSPEESPAVTYDSKWFNIDDVMGVVNLLGSGKSTYVPNHRPVRARIEQPFFLSDAGTSAPGDSADESAPNRVLAETALLFYPGRTHEETRRLAASSVSCEPDAAVPGRYVVKLDDGTTLRIDLAGLAISFD